MMKTFTKTGPWARQFETSPEAVIVIDIDDRIVYANPAACRVTGYELDALVGTDAYLPMAPNARDALRSMIQEHAATREPGTILRGTTTLIRPAGQEYEIEFTAVPLSIDAKPQVVVMFHDITNMRRLGRELEALTRIASQVAFADSLKATLDHLAESVVKATGTVACGVCLVGEDADDVQVFGKYGLPEGPEAQACWRKAMERGAKLPNTESIRAKKPLIHVDARAKLLENPLYEPIHDLVRDAGWDTVVSVPMLARNQAIGALNVFYPRGKPPGEADLAFLTAISNQAAIAADNARLFEEAKEKAILEERQRLARELHDSVSQALYGIALGARTARELLDREPAQAAEPLDYVLSLAEAGLAEMRALIFELRPEALETEGLVAALTKQIESARVRHSIEIHAEWCGEPDLPYPVKEAIYRIAQEALNNITKHARARRVDVRMDCSSDEVTLDVSDDGIGFADESFPGHLGLRSMRERAKNVGGTLEVDSAPDHGTRIRVRIPYEPGAAEPAQDPGPP